MSRLPAGEWSALESGILRWQNRKCATAAGIRLRDWN
ncbi:MAG: hypothetical protein F4Y12_13080 [Acidimicrobiaceae bacterium]|nr:hypothetical protein [Acidimicrobiaceae bacterium]MYH78145.1 hypothetical protein [Acidimicrobiaceae bacterium]MYK75609.1 hypothetical protein [Acidimicrobiaceae bacterium]